MLCLKKKLEQVKHTEDRALVPCFGIPLETDFPTFKLLLEAGPVEIDFADSNESRKKQSRLAIKNITKRREKTKPAKSTTKAP